jgi:hypothetical protein
MRILFVRPSRDVVPLHKFAFQPIEKLETLRDTDTLNSKKQKLLTLLYRWQELKFVDAQYVLITLTTKEKKVVLAAAVEAVAVVDSAVEAVEVDSAAVVVVEAVVEVDSAVEAEEVAVVAAEEAEVEVPYTRHQVVLLLLLATRLHFNYIQSCLLN